MHRGEIDVEYARIYIVINSIFLFTSSFAIVFNNDRNIYLFGLDLVIGICGLIFSIILALCVIGMFLAKKVAYIIALITYIIMLMASFMYNVAVFIFRPSIVANNIMGVSVVLVPSLLINIAVIRWLYIKVKESNAIIN